MPLRDWSIGSSIVNDSCHVLIKAMRNSIATWVRRYEPDSMMDWGDITLNHIDSDEFYINSLHFVCNTDGFACIVLAVSVGEFTVCIVIPHHNTFEVHKLCYKDAMDAVRECLNHSLKCSFDGYLSRIRTAGSVHYDVMCSGSSLDRLDEDGLIDPAIMISKALHEKSRFIKPSLTGNVLKAFTHSE